MSSVSAQPSLEQVYGGNDYGDGGQEGAVQCEDCCGMYVTGLCEGRPSFDSGKFHNHCVQCPDFGQCIGDYREAHCMDCGKHWFAGMSGFACTHCGGGDGRGRKAQPLGELPPPPPSAFDGVLEGAVAKVREIWREINEPNLVENILPTRARASLVLRKEHDHTVSTVLLRKI